MDCNVSKAERAAWLREKLRKVEAYKYPLLVLLLGAGLLLLPREGGAQPTAAPETAAATAEEPAALEAKLENLLSQMEGAGAVQVVLTLEKSASYTYQTDRETRDGEERRETVLVSDGAGGEAPVTQETAYPVYQGAVVACQGADSAQVRLDIVRAVASLTGLSSDRITVIKLKRS
ncbi:MAG TPA: stage III sporulation protein AG [Candidatus Avoscillospira avicola]|uniref:Stage III sporulation protein AG n=1 Tax=Candidatus Avoscillospira avicola TaxID=2840706 RepID=A0A9D1DIW1_9FIRM|nr:stage III sporulation protein AG [Candidatus Avoscillospira avicola]